MRRTALCCSLVLAGLLALPAHAATLPSSVSFTDQTGDANGLNSQGFMPLSGQSTAPAELASADIVGVRVATLYKKRKPYALSVTLTLAAAPDSVTDYIVNASVPDGCGGGSRINLQYGGFGAFPSTVANCTDSTSSAAIGLGPAQVDAAKHTITWLIDGSGFKKKGRVEELTALTTVLVAGYYDEATTDKALAYQ